MPFGPGWQQRAHAEAYRAALAKHTGLGQLSRRAIENEWQDAVERIYAADLAAENGQYMSSWWSWIAAVAWTFFFAAAVICLCWEVYVRREWREDIIEIFQLPEDSTIFAICVEILTCIGLRIWQLFSAIGEILAFFIRLIIIPLKPPARWAVGTTTNIRAKIDEATTGWQDWQFSQTVLHYWNRTQAGYHFVVRNLAIIYATICFIAIVIIIFYTTKPWEAPVLYLKAWMRSLEPVPADFKRAKSGPGAAPQHQQRPVWRDVPTAQVIGIDVPISVPAPTMGMGRPEQVPRSSPKTTIAGGGNVYCSKCKQWHCCELPY